MMTIPIFRPYVFGHIECRVSRYPAIRHAMEPVRPTPEEHAVILLPAGSMSMTRSRLSSIPGIECRESLTEHSHHVPTRPRFPYRDVPGMRTRPRAREGREMGRRRDGRALRHPGESRALDGCVGGSPAMEPFAICCRPRVRRQGPESPVEKREIARHGHGQGCGRAGRRAWEGRRGDCEHGAPVCLRCDPTMVSFECARLVR